MTAGCYSRVASVASVACGVLLCAWFSPSSAASSRPDLDVQAPHLRDYIGFLRQLIAANGSPEAKAVDANVDFTAVESTFPFASSGKSPDGRKQIRMSTQYRLTLVYFEELNLVVGEDARLTPCKLEYVEMVGKLYADNMENVAAKRDVDDTPAPEVFATATRANCQAVERNVPVKAELRQFRDYQVNLAVAFTYLHELGHLVLGHRAVTDDIFTAKMTDKERMQAFLSGMRLSREQEYAADRFAVRELARLRVHPLEVLSPPLNDMLVATSGFDCAMRLGSTHPDPTARMRNIIRTVEATGFSPVKKGPDAAFTHQLFGDFLAFYGRVDTTLECPDDDANT